MEELSILVVMQLADQGQKLQHLLLVEMLVAQEVVIRHHVNFTMEVRGMKTTILIQHERAVQLVEVIQA